MNGPRVVSRGKEVSVAWHTEAGGKPRVQLATSADRGATFRESILIDEDGPVGRADVALLDGGRTAVCWLGRLDAKRAEVRVRSIGADGKPGDAIPVGEVPADRSSGFPRMASTGSSLIVAWTDPTNGFRVRTAVVTDP